MKKIILTLLCMLSSIAFAQVTTINPNHAENISHWQFLNSNDGMIFLLGPESPYILLIKVDQKLANNLPTDTITVYCNNSMYRLSGGSSIKCYGNMNDTASMSVTTQDFKNGSEGIYKFIPKNKV